MSALILWRQLSNPEGSVFLDKDEVVNRNHIRSFESIPVQSTKVPFSGRL